MTTPEIPAPEPGETPQGTQSAEEVREAAKSLRDLFSTLVPPDEIEIRDVFGGSYTVRAVLPARRQIVVMRKIESLLSVNAEVGALAGSGIEGIAGALITLASNEAVLDGISAAFESAHPSVVGSARSLGRESGLSEEEISHPADLFSIEELVGGLVPFFVRLIAKMVDLFGTVIGASDET